MPRYSVTMFDLLTRLSGPRPAVLQSAFSRENGTRHDGELTRLLGSEAVSDSGGAYMKQPPLSRWQIRLPCAKARAMSRDGA